MYQPWLARYYPAVTIAALEAGYWTLHGYVDMADAIKQSPGLG